MMYHPIGHETSFGCLLNVRITSVRSGRNRNVQETFEFKSATDVHCCTSFDRPESAPIKSAIVVYYQTNFQQPGNFEFQLSNFRKGIIRLVRMQNFQKN